MGLGKLTKIEFEATPAMIAELEECCAVMKAAKGVPTCTGYYDRRGKLRRVVARYPDGWRFQVNIDAEGYVTTTRADLKLPALSEGARS